MDGSSYPPKTGRHWVVSGGGEGERVGLVSEPECPVRQA